MRSLFNQESQYFMLEEQRRNKTEKGLSFWIAIMLLTSVYLVPTATSISFGEIFVMISIVWIVLKNRKIMIYKNNALSMFVIYTVLSSILIAMIKGAVLIDTVFRLIRDAFYWIIIYVFGYSFLNYNVFKKWVKIICIVLSTLIILQFTVFVVTGYLVPGFPMNAIVAKTCTAREIYQHTITTAIRNGYLKANGFLKEGAHCGHAIAICLVLIFDFECPERTTRKSFFTLGFLSFASVLTFSATGLALTFIIWIFIILVLMSSRRVARKTGIPILIILIILLGMMFIVDSLNISSVLGRITSAASGNTADNSAFYRIYKGFIFWGNLPIEIKIFGLGFGNYNSLYHLSTGMAGTLTTTEYMSSFSYILVSAGLVGFAFYFVYVVQMFRQSNKKGKVMSVILVIMSLTSSPYSSVFWVWMILIILSNTNGSIEKIGKRRFNNEFDIIKHCGPH